MDAICEKPLKKRRKEQTQMSLELAAFVMGVTRVRAWQLEQRALRKLRRSPLLRELAEELGLLP
jgi:DNA-directed RNA polymerase sigma subunit (sigma70/sigma32)